MMMRYLAFFVIFLPAFIFGDTISNFLGGVGGSLGGEWGDSPHKPTPMVEGNSSPYTVEVRVLSFVRCFSHSLTLLY